MFLQRNRQENHLTTTFVLENVTGYKINIKVNKRDICHLISEGLVSCVKSDQFHNWVEARCAFVSLLVRQACWCIRADLWLRLKIYLKTDFIWRELLNFPHLHRHSRCERGPEWRAQWIQSFSKGTKEGRDLVTNNPQIWLYLTGQLHWTIVPVSFTPIVLLCVEQQ